MSFDPIPRAWELARILRADVEVESERVASETEFIVLRQLVDDLEEAREGALMRDEGAFLLEKGQFALAEEQFRPAIEVLRVAYDRIKREGSELLRSVMEAMPDPDDSANSTPRVVLARAAEELDADIEFAKTCLAEAQRGRAIWGDEMPPEPPETQESADARYQKVLDQKKKHDVRLKTSLVVAIGSGLGSAFWIVAAIGSGVESDWWAAIASVGLSVLFGLAALLAGFFGFGYAMATEYLIGPGDEEMTERAKRDGWWT